MCSTRISIIALALVCIPPLIGCDIEDIEDSEIYDVIESLDEFEPLEQKGGEPLEYPEWSSDEVRFTDEFGEIEDIEKPDTEIPTMVCNAWSNERYVDTNEPCGPVVKLQNVERRDCTQCWPDQVECSTWYFVGTRCPLF